MRGIALTVLALLLATPGVAAHAEAVASGPASGEQLSVAPVEAWVQFSEPFDKRGSWLRVQSSEGDRVDLDNLQFEDAPVPTMRIGLGPMQNGSYILLWQTFSPSDGHTVRGAIGFSVGPHEPPSAEGLAVDVSIVGIVARALVYVAIVGAVGLLGFTWWVQRQPMVSTPTNDRWLLVTALIGAAGAGLLMVDALLATGLGGTAFLASAAGRGLFVRLAVAIAVLLLTGLWLYGPVQPRMRYHVLGAVWLLVILAGSQFGHLGGPAAPVVQSVHAVSMALWLGGLFAYLLWMRRSDTTADAAMALGPRFGTMALITSMLLVVTGVLMSVGILGINVASEPFGYPWRTVLTLKIGLALLMLLVAGVNRFIVLGQAPWSVAARARLVSILRLQPADDAGALQRLVAVEIALGLVAIGLAAALMSLAPAV